MTTSVPTTVLEHIAFIYSNLDGAQQLRGSLSLSDCQSLLLSLNCLQQRFTPVNGAFRASDKMDGKAISCIRSCAEVLQKTGVFSIQGSSDLLNSIETIETALKPL